MTEEYNDLTSEQDISDTKDLEIFIYQKIPWEAGKSGLEVLLDLSEKYAHQKDTCWINNWLFRASLMREFDPRRFDKEIGVTDSTREKLVKEANYRIDEGYYSILDPKEHSTQAARLNPGRVWEFLENFKLVDPEGFAQNIEIPKKHWAEAPEWLKQRIKYEDVYCFISVYKSAQTIDAQRINKLVPISKNLWGTIRATLLKNPYAPDIAIAQKIKPEGFPDIEIPQEIWLDHMRAVKEWIQSDRAIEDTERIIQFAKILKNKEVKIENLEI